MNTLPLRFAAVIGAAILSVSAALGQSLWRGDDIGSVGLPGRSAETAGGFEIVGAGADIWDRADGFHFLHQPLNGDGELVVRVASQQNTNSWAKAGVMLREGTPAGARHAFICVTPGNGVVFQYREATGGTSASMGGGSGALPVWLKLVRVGNVVTGSMSANGSTWAQVGTVTFSNLTAALEAGVAVTSHDTSVSSTARVDNVALRTSSGPSTPPASGAPVITPKPSQSINSGYLFTYQIAASNSPTSYGATGLPPGLTLNSATGEIRGVCGGTAGTYAVTLRATNAAGTGSATQTMVVSGGGPIEMPWIEQVTPPVDGTYRVGDTLVFRVKTRAYYGRLVVMGRPRFTFTLGGNTRFADYAWGSGSDDEVHVYTYNVTAADAGAVGIQTSDTIDLNGGMIQDPWPLACALSMRPVMAAGVRCEAGSVAPTGAPVLSTPERVLGKAGQPFSFQITASGVPTSFAATFGATPARPLGVAFNASTGVLSGTLAASGLYTVTLSATNAAGSGTKVLAISVPHVITAVTMPAAGTYRVGSTLSIRLTFSNPMRITGTPSLPLGIGDNGRQASYAFGSEREHTFSYTVQPGDVDLDGYIGVGPAINLNSGTIQDAESGDMYGTTLPRNLVIRDAIVDAPGAPAPQITSPATASGTVGAAFSYAITATNSPTSFGASGLPGGLSVNAATGVISGSPTVSGTFFVQVRAANNGGAAEMNVQVTIAAGGSAGWQSRDIGGVAATGSSSEEGGVVTVRGSGEDIWDNRDEFHFRYLQLADGGELTARVTSLSAVHPWAKAGIMFRDSLEPNAGNLMLFVSRDNGLARQFRSRSDAATVYASFGAPTRFPTWLRVVRNGIWLENYTSSDGVSWQKLDSVYWANANPIYIGLAVTSHADGTVATATFDQVRVNGREPPSGPPGAPSLNAFVHEPREVLLSWSDPGFTETGFELERSTDGATFARIATTGVNQTQHADVSVSPSTTYHYRVRAVNGSGASPYSEVKTVTTPAVAAPTSAWEFGDIGAVGVAGSNNSSGNTITIQASGADVWDNADSFRFVYRRVSGNVVVEARVTSLTAAHPWAKAGVMIRQSLGADARNVFVYVTPNQVAAQARSATGAATAINGGPWTSAPQWVRLVRVGERVTAYSSYDAISWTEIAAYDVAMGEPVYAGFALTSHDNSQLATAVFTDPYLE